MATGNSDEEPGRSSETSTGFPPLPYRTGAAVGVGAGVLGYLITVVLTATRALDAVSVGPAVIDGLPGWMAVGWLFYSAHGVGVRFVEAGGDTVVVDFVEASGGALTSLYIVPPAVLLIAGGVVAIRSGATGPKSGARAGVTVVTGYAVALFVGGAFLGATLGSYTAGPTLPLVAAVGYPLVFGPMGGVAGAALSLTPAAKRSDESTEATDQTDPSDR